MHFDDDSLVHVIKTPSNAGLPVAWCDQASFAWEEAPNAMVSCLRCFVRSKLWSR